MTEQDIIKQFADKGLIDPSYNPDDWHIDAYKCYCSCEECREWERKTGQKPDCEYYTEED